MKPVLDEEMADLDKDFCVFTQLMELHAKMISTYGVKNLDEEDFGQLCRLLLSRKRHRHLLTAIAVQQPKLVVDHTAIIQEQNDKTGKELIKSTLAKKFLPNHKHHQEITDLLDEQHLYQEIRQELNDVLKKFYVQDTTIDRKVKKFGLKSTT